jgi:hypothetical protein
MTRISYPSATVANDAFLVQALADVLEGLAVVVVDGADLRIRIPSSIFVMPGIKRLAASCNGHLWA